MLKLIFSYIAGVNRAVGEVIRELRKEYKVSQEKLADGIDSHQVYISEIEKGDKLPSLIVLRNIATFFQLSLTEMVSRIESKLK